MISAGAQHSPIGSPLMNKVMQRKTVQLSTSQFCRALFNPLWDLIRGLKAVGRTILLTTHYMEEAEVLCDRLAIMDHGQILEMGTVDELVSKRFKERAVRFDAIDRVSDGDLAALPAVSHLTHDADEVLLYTSDVAATIGALLSLGEDRGFEPQNLGVRRATLEDVFLDLTGRALRD